MTNINTWSTMDENGIFLKEAEGLQLAVKLGQDVPGEWRVFRNGMIARQGLVLDHDGAIMRGFGDSVERMAKRTCEEQAMEASAVAARRASMDPSS